jgi:hypothetical protein
MNENITKNEILNDGKTIHLYFNGMIGLYVAYGISAFLLCKYAKAKPSYSDDMQMPVAVINAEHYEALEEQLGLSKTFKNYRCLKVVKAYDENEYEEWASALRVGGDSFVIKSQLVYG